MLAVIYQVGQHSGTPRNRLKPHEPRLNWREFGARRAVVVDGFIGHQVGARRANGERRTRTADTSIFSRVLYQLSYLAATLILPPRRRRMSAAEPDRRAMTSKEVESRRAAQFALCGCKRQASYPAPACLQAMRCGSASSATYRLGISTGEIGRWEVE